MRLSFDLYPNVLSEFITHFKLLSDQWVLKNAKGLIWVFAETSEAIMWVVKNQKKGYRDQRQH